MNKKKKSTNTSPYPDEVIDRLARAFYPAILACWNSEEGQRSLVGARPLHLLLQDRSVAPKPHWGFHCCAAQTRSMRFERSGRGGQTSGQSSLCGCRILSYPAATAKSKPPCAVGMAPAALVEVLHLLLRSLFLLTFPLTVSRGMHRFCTHLSACVQQRLAHHRAFHLGKRQPHFLFQLPDSIGQAGLRNIELLHCMAAGAGNSRDITELLKGHGSFLSACFFYPTAEPPKTQRIFFFEIPNEHCRHIQDTFYPPCNFPYNSTAVLKRLQHSHITKEAFRYGTTAK